MIPMPDLSSDELVALFDDMRLGPYVMQPSVQLLNRDHVVLSDLSDRVTDGQVDCKLTGKVSTRSCSLTLVDPGREVAIDGADISDGALFYDKMIAAGVRFNGPRLGRWVTMPLFCGPMTNASRSGWSAQVTAQGKEQLATGQVWTPRTYPAGAQKIATLRDLLEQTGEADSRIQLPGIVARLPKDLSLQRTDTAWPPVMSISDSLTRQGLYDGRGDFRLRSWPDDPKVIFTDGPGGTILSNPEVTYDEYQGFNGVWVKGPVKRSGKRIEAEAWLPRNHQLSPWSRQRGGVPFRKAYVVTNSKVRTQAEADAVAERYLRRLVREVVRVRADVMPNWLLEPGDVAAMQTAYIGHVEQVMTEFSLPLVAGAAMSFGAVKPVTRAQPSGRSSSPTRHTTAQRKVARAA